MLRTNNVSGQVNGVCSKMKLRIAFLSCSTMMFGTYLTFAIFCSFDPENLNFQHSFLRYP